jgi:mRNA interferase MazF
MEGPLNGQVVTVLYPYTDLSGVKKRPALVLARLNSDDYLLCQIPSQPLLSPGGIQVRPEHFTTGGLSRISQIRCDKLLTAHHSIITAITGELSGNFFESVKNEVLALIQNGEPTS